jgi:hypothetical protein
LYGDWASSSAVRIVNYTHGAIGMMCCKRSMLGGVFYALQLPIGSRFKLYYFAGAGRVEPLSGPLSITLEATLALRTKLLQAGVSVRLVRGVEGVWSNMWSWDDRHRHPRGLCIVTR